MPVISTFIAYLLSGIVLCLLLLGYFHLAARFNIIDKPNQRSSHTYLTVRGGGIVFPLAVLLWFLFYGFEQPLMVAGLLAMAVISFTDDVKTLSGKVRIGVHLLAVSLVFYQLAIFGLPWWLVLLAYIFTIGWINAFNFMDGINGITVFYALISLLTFAWVNLILHFAPDSLLILLILSCIVFAWFNARRQARCFAGDVGSVSMAFILAWLMLMLMVKSGRIEYILFFSVYAVDSVFTIVHRLLRHENIFRAHRFHLYQLLSNEKRLPHLWVAALYALLQTGINMLVLAAMHQGTLNHWRAGGLLLLISVVYLLLRLKIWRSLQSQHSM